MAFILIMSLGLGFVVATRLTDKTSNILSTFHSFMENYPIYFVFTKYIAIILFTSALTRHDPILFYISSALIIIWGITRVRYHTIGEYRFETILWTKIRKGKLI